MTPGAPAIGAHRLLSNGRALALVTPAGEVDWWCAPDLDSPPLLWSMLDPQGAAARWADAALACSVASLLGHRAAARDYLEFVVGVAGDQPDHIPPWSTSAEAPSRPSARWRASRAWAQSTPVRVGNGAAGQPQYDSWGLVAEAVSVHLQTGGTIDRATWRLLQRLADRVAAEEPEPSSGIWELRTPKLPLSGDLGRWLLLDRALWIARGVAPVDAPAPLEGRARPHPRPHPGSARRPRRPAAGLRRRGSPP